jgi:hypothetical protein
LAKSLCWRLEVQRFPGPLVELARHLVQLGLRVCRTIASFTIASLKLIFVNRVGYQSPTIAALEHNLIKLVFVHERPWFNALEEH